jgi:hypothetical protein
MAQRHRDSGRKGGLVTSAIPGHMQRAGRIGGSVKSERKSRHLRRLATEFSPENGRRNVESGHLDRIRTLEGCAAGGRTPGQRSVENGHIFTIQEMACSLGGQVMGKKNAESGHMNAIRTPESTSKGGTASCHLRWHTNRGISKPKICELCAVEASGSRITP